MPLQIAGAIFQYAKLRMLQFYYDFLVKYNDEADFEMMYMDTDNMYMAITADNFDDIIKPEMKKGYEEIKTQWFPQIKYDKRTAGLFKVEYEGMINSLVREHKRKIMYVSLTLITVENG